MVIGDDDDSHGRQVRWSLRAGNATDSIGERSSCASWIIELVSTSWQDGKPFDHAHLFIIILGTSLKALLALVRLRWAIENQGLLAPRHPSSGRTRTATSRPMACRLWPCSEAWACRRSQVGCLRPFSCEVTGSSAAPCSPTCRLRSESRPIIHCGGDFPERCHSSGAV